LNTWDIFVTNAKNASVKWTQYFPVYDRHFSSWKNKTLTFLEIGTYYGGGGQIWSRFFGPMAQIVSIDIDPNCKKNQTDQYQVRIGDQSDPKFLQSVIDEFGVPDIVLDDGSHQQDHVYATFSHIYPKMHLNSIYMIEDLHTSYWSHFKGGYHESGTFMNRSKNYIDQLNQMHNGLPVDPVIRDTFAISFYDSIAVFEKGRTFRKTWEYSSDPEHSPN